MTQVDFFAVINVDMRQREFVPVSKKPHSVLENLGCGGPAAINQIHAFSVDLTIGLEYGKRAFGMAKS
jgi:hypothetical protein